MIENNAETVELNFRDLEKNNPAKLNELKNNSPEEYARLYEKEYGVAPKM